jgi:hypothetical protein
MTTTSAKDLRRVFVVPYRFATCRQVIHSEYMPDKEVYYLDDNGDVHYFQYAGKNLHYGRNCNHTFLIRDNQGEVVCRECRSFIDKNEV